MCFWLYFGKLCVSVDKLNHFFTQNFVGKQFDCLQGHRLRLLLPPDSKYGSEKILPPDSELGSGKWRYMIHVPKILDEVDVEDDFDFFLNSVGN